MDGQASTQQPALAPKLLDGAEWERAARQYEAIIGMIQDTGTLIWTINGAYLVAVTLVATPLLQSLEAPHKLQFLITGGLGVALCLLWFGSFERNYAFYSLRINHAKSLETGLGFSLFKNGHALGNPPHQVTIDGRVHKIPIWGRYVSIQWWTRLLIGVAFVGFATVIALGYRVQ